MPRGPPGWEGWSRWEGLGAGLWCRWAGWGRTATSRAKQVTWRTGAKGFRGHQLTPHKILAGHTMQPRPCPSPTPSQHSSEVFSGHTCRVGAAGTRWTRGFNQGWGFAGRGPRRERGRKGVGRYEGHGAGGLDSKPGQRAAARGPGEEGGRDWGGQ